jgi:hypothetical protein
MGNPLTELVAESIDRGLRLGTLTDSALKARKLAQLDRLVLASPAIYTKRRSECFSQTCLSPTL